MKITWSALHDIGTSKVVNTSFIWLALIPFLARVLEALHEAGAQVPELPFNFIAFYYAAFCFTLGAVLFNFFCPKIIKLTPTFGTFASEQYSLVELKNWMHDMTPTEPVHADARADALKHFLSLEKPNLNFDSPLLKDGKVSDALLSAFWEETAWTKRESLPQLHDLAVNYGEKQNTYWRAFAAVMYAIGFLFFAVVVILNLIVVCKESGKAIGPLFSW